MSTSIYAAKPWLGLLSEAQRRPVHPQPSVVHAFRDAVARAPEHPALAYFDGRLTYRETDTLSDSVAGHLAARGVGRGDRVAVMLQNSPHFVLALLGAWKAGATVVPLNPMYKSAEVGHALRDSRRHGTGLLRPCLGDVSAGGLPRSRLPAAVRADRLRT